VPNWRRNDYATFSDRASLFREAFAQVSFDGDEVELPDDLLLRQVVHGVVDEVKSVSSAEELFSRLSNSTERLTLWIEIDNALDRLSDHVEIVADALEKVWYA
jgi:hypothetical protein